MKTALNASLCAVADDSRLRRPHGGKAYFRGVCLAAFARLTGLLRHRRSRAAWAGRC